MAKISIEQAKKLFDDWRKVREGRGAATPARLRQIALAIKSQHGERIARETLGLSSETFWRWGREAGRGETTRWRVRSKRLYKAKHDAASEVPLQFVEVTPAATEVRTDSSLTISFERADGARMKLSGTMEPTQIERLAGRFLAGALT